MGKLATDPKPGDVYVNRENRNKMIIQSVEERQTDETCGGVTDGYGVVNFILPSGAKDSYSGNWNYIIELGIVIAAGEKCWWI